MKKVNLYLFILTCSAFLTSCSSDDDENNNSGNPQASSEYVIAATPTALEGVADYLLTTESISEGAISLLGNGIEQDGTYRYYITNNNKFFSLLYGQGNPGAVTTYELNQQGNLDLISDFQAETVQAFTNVDDEVLMTKISRNSDDATASWYRLDTQNLQIVGEGSINTAELAPGDEQAFFTWMTQVDDKVYAPFMSIKACCNDGFGTEYPNQTWIAIYSYPEMELEKVIEDDRMSFVGRYFRDGLGVVENGDIYAFSSAVATSNGEASSSTPSAVLKINNEETEFDEDYYFDLEAASGGYHMTNQYYSGNGNFVVFMNTENNKGAYADGKKIAIVNVYDKTLTWVTGTPDESAIESITYNNFIENGIAHVGITTTEGSFVYQVNIDNATATQGVEIEGGSITAISKLNVTE